MRWPQERRYFVVHTIPSHVTRGGMIDFHPLEGWGGFERNNQEGWIAMDWAT